MNNKIKDELLELFEITGTTIKNQLLIVSGRVNISEIDKKIIIYYYSTKKNKQLLKKFNIDHAESYISFIISESILEEIKNLIYVAQVLDDLDKSDKTEFEISDNIFIDFIFKYESEIIFANISINLETYFNKISKEIEDNNFINIDEIFI